MKSYLEIKAMDCASWMISEGTGRGRTHCYLLEGEKNALLIDTGLGLVDMKSITKSLTDKEVIVVNTHGHLDHISRNYQFSTVYLHPNDEEVYKIHSGSEMRYEYHKNRYLSKGYSKLWVNSPFFRWYLKPLWYLPERNNRVPCHDSMILDLGKRPITIYATPGHTGGSVCLLDQTRRWLFTGDTICEQGVLLQFEESCSVEEYLMGLNRLKEIETSYDSLFCGHQKVPLDKSYLDDYIDTAKYIIEKYASQAVETYSDTIQYKRAAITFDFRKVLKEYSYGIL